MAFLPHSKAPALTYERANELLTYCHISGMLRWRISRAGCVAGEIVGTLANGYLQVQIDLVFYRAHRVAWLLHYGRWPSKGLDHRNGKRADNRIANLREATPAENARNRGICRRNTSGKVGVHPILASGLWGAGIWSNGRQIPLGRFECKEAAIEARCEAERHYFGEFARQVDATRSSAAMEGGHDG
jgi:hypothetical protein